MNYQEVLKNLEAFKAFVERDDKWDKETHEKICMLYGSIEEVINRFGGIDKIEVPIDGVKPVVYPNLVAAAYLSGSTYHVHQGYTQLLKVIGKVKHVPLDSDHVLTARDLGISFGD